MPTMRRRQGRRSRGRQMRIRLVPWGLALATVVVFSPALWNEFVSWDDHAMFVGNPHYRGLGWAQIKWMFTSQHMAHYMPLSWLSSSLDYVFWGMNPTGYHLTNVLLHALNVAVVYFLAARLLTLAAPEEPGESGAAARVGAAVTALLFGLHPLRVESVAWATERRDVLSGLFYLLALVAYLRAHAPDRAPGASGQRWHRASLGLFVLALLSKSMAVSLPLVLLILDVYPLRRLGGPRSWLGPGRAVLMEKIPFVALSFAASVVALIGTVTSPQRIRMTDLGLPGRLAVSVYDLAFYLWKSVAPVNLLPLYELHWGTSFLSWPFLVSGAVVVALTAVAVRVRHRYPALLAAWASYVVILLPVLGIVHSGSALAADRYTYLACLGWALLVGGGVRHVRRRTSNDARLDRRWAAVAIVLALSIGALAALTWRQIAVWHDSEALWTRVIAGDPRAAIAHHGLGRLRVAQDRMPEAVEHLARAAARRPDYFGVQSDHGVVLVRLGRFREAIAPLESAVKLRPELPYAHNDAGLARMGVNEWGAAAAHFEQALRLAPDFVLAHANLGVALVRQGKPADGLRHMERALVLDPALPGLAQAREEAAAMLSPGTPRRQ